MKFGFFMMPLHHPTENPTLAYERDLQFIEQAERLGFDECFIGEHHSAGWETIPAPEIFIAAAAQRTKTITLGTGVINLAYHHPFLVAERMAFLDHLTRGRIVLGVGPGVLATDIMMFGLSKTKVRSMMEESVDIIIRLLESDGPLTYDGKYWQIKNMEIQLKSYQQPRLPIAMASSGSATSLDTAGRHGLPVWSFVGREFPGSVPLSDMWEIMERGAKKTGRQISRKDWRLVVQAVYVAESREQAINDIREGVMRDIHQYYFGLGGKILFEDYPDQSPEDIDVEQIVRRGGLIIGTPEDVSRQIRKFDNEAGGSGGLLITTNEWVSVEKTYASMELFARYVIPDLQSTNSGLLRAWDKVGEAREDGSLEDFSRFSGTGESK